MKKTRATAIPDDVESLKQQLLEMQTLLQKSQRESLHHQQESERVQKESAHHQREAKRFQQLYNHALEQWQLALRKRFAASSEGHPGQGELFNEVEECLTPSAEEVAADETITYTRKKSRRPSLAAELPREDVVHDIADADKVCDDCGHDLHQMGEEVSEKLEFIPATVKVIRHIRPKYSCRCCEQQATRTTIKIAPAPASLLPKSIATPTLLSQIITAKYQFGLPLYRQAALFKSFGIELHRQTMSRWLLKVSTQLTPLYQRMHALMLERPALWSDDTSVKVIDVDKVQCTMWVYGCGGDKPAESLNNMPSPPNIVLYDYQDGRGGIHPNTFLAGYHGLLHVDGYAGYHGTDAMLAGCWAHARRKFIEAKAVQPKGKIGRADQALNLIQKLYGIEKPIRQLSIEDKRAARQAQSAPIMEQLKAWLDKALHQVPPKNAIGKAIGYTLNQWDKLQVYLEHGAAAIDNNRAERAIKPFVIGRKNWLFSNSRSGAQASAMLYSLIETAKANDVPPGVYLTALFEQLPHLIDGESVDHLLPWAIRL
ncbi:IS66 family transposase [Oceanisphaera sp. IT1-181]|uniref:IS66 family transposase n=1 Tax=Oceanisphaera sp. IT1-181 TaxID=3081199 RepID=UPI0029CA9D8D|nr:IS66 family transposase [Oceanisphaera sp. IT1-181]